MGKGGVENGVAVVRRLAFTPMPHALDHAELQQHVDGRCLEYTRTHKIRYRLAGIKAMFEEERRFLTPCRFCHGGCQNGSRPGQFHLTVLLDGARYSVPLNYVGERVTLKVSPFTVAVWARGEEVYRHKRALQKGGHQYVPEHYLEV